MNSAVAHDDSLRLARQLVDAIESGDDQGAGHLINALNDSRFETLFQEIGKLTRELHDTVSGLAADSRLMELAQEAIPDARDRLNYVIEKTEESADRTLTAVETMQAVNEGFVESAERLRGVLQSEADAAGLQAAANDIMACLDSGTASLREGFTEVTMAQEYQDLTGQVIKRTITLVGQVEEKLVGLVRACGEVTRETEAQPGQETTAQSHGPAIHATSEVVARQDDVDELLADLGF